ncbi:DUF4795 domain-containing protein [Bdellovibrionota bacterium FG-1]
MGLWIYFKIRNRIIVITVFMAVMAFSCPSGWAGPIPDSFLENTLFRFVFTETIEGRMIMDRVVGPSASFEQMRAKLDVPEFQPLRNDLENRLQKLQERMIEQTENRGSQELTSQQKIYLRSMVSEEFRINPRWNGDWDANSVPFFEASPENGVKAKKATWGKTHATDPASMDAMDALEKPPVGFKSAPRKLSRWLDGMSECRRAMPPPQVRLQNIRYLLLQLGIDEAMTVGGAVIAAGSSEVDWNSMPFDLAFEAMNSLAGSKVVGLQGKFILRWIRLGGVGAAFSGGDATIYYLSQPAGPHPLPTKEDGALDRFKYNLGWSAGYAPFHIALYDLLMGLECLYPSGTGAMAVLGLQLGSGLASNVAYFGIRNYLYR